MGWKKANELNKTGYILALCQDNTGIYNSLMIVAIENGKRNFYQNVGILGESVRVYPDKVKAAIYVDEVCPDEIVKQYCDKEKEDEKVVML